MDDSTPPPVAPTSIVMAAIVIALVAIALRMPACYESFWVDELHTAWCVWGELSQVAARADAGHQSPFYFSGLWFWKQWCGDSELILRFSSVLAVSLSCVLLTVGVAFWSRSLAAGVTAGSILAIENNSIFFGTELRPYAWVILWSSSALICFLILANQDSRHESRRTWLLFVISILLAGLYQPTSWGVLLWLPTVLGMRWAKSNHRGLLRITLSDVLLLLAATATTFTLWSLTLNESWGQRSNWATFASAHSWLQIWQIWDWTWLWCIPVATVAIVMISGHRCRSTVSVPMIALALIAAGSTFAYWWVSWLQWLPLWHRRYLIAVLPTFAVLAGGSVAVLGERTSRLRLAPLLAILLIFGLAYRQNFHRLLRGYPVALVSRGEDWRAAVDWVRRESNDADSVYLEPGLIEWQSPNDANTDQIDYLKFPVRGPYRVDQGVQLIKPDLQLPTPDLYDDTKQIFLIVRRPARQIRIDPTKWGWVYGNRYVGDVKSFGNVTVISMPVVAR